MLGHMDDWRLRYIFTNVQICPLKSIYLYPYLGSVPGADGRRAVAGMFIMAAGLGEVVSWAVLHTFFLQSVIPFTTNVTALSKL